LLNRVNSESEFFSISVHSFAVTHLLFTSVGIRVGLPA